GAPPPTDLGLSGEILPLDSPAPAASPPTSTTAPAPSGGALPLGGAAADRDELAPGGLPLAAPVAGRGRTTRRHKIPWAAAAGALARLEILSGKSEGEVHPLTAQEHRV